VGLESHFEVGGTPSLEDQVTTKQGFVALGLEVAVTELDVRFVEANATNATGFAVQAQNYYDSVSSCLQVEGCIGITVWDFDDQYSWIPSSFPGQGAADLYNSDFTRKPAYYAVGEALGGVPCSVCSG
jgi:endo-1,4-beta-xylanase